MGQSSAFCYGHVCTLEILAKRSKMVYSIGMPYYTPLRYPGGKRQLIPTIKYLLEKNGLKDVEYAEPYAGGAAIALSLLMEEYASVIHINDLSRPVYAFWHSVFNSTEELCQRIESVEITMAEHARQRSTHDHPETATLLDLGGSAFFLNRTNRSGIMTGGVIGGKSQSGRWLLDVRFNKEELIQRIRRIGRYRHRVRLYQMDGLDFTNKIISRMPSSAFIFYDPPYIERGEALYLNKYDVNDHRRLAARVMQLEQLWAVTYDEAAIRHRLYEACRRITYQLSYSAQTRYRGKEVMFVSRHIKLPKTWYSSTPIPLGLSTRSAVLMGMAHRAIK